MDEGERSPAGGRLPSWRAWWPAYLTIPVLLVATGLGLAEVGGWVGAVGLVVVLGAVFGLTAWVRSLLTASRTREQHLQVLIDTLPDTMVMVVDTDLRMIEAAGAHLATVPAQKRAMVGKHISDVLDGELLAFWTEHWNRALGGERLRVEQFGPYSGRYVEIDLAPLVGHDGAIRGAMAVTRDVHDRHVAAEALAMERRRAQAAFEAAPFGVAIIDPETRTWLAVNDGWARMLGYDVDELVGRHVLEFSHPDDLYVGAQSVEELMELGTVQTIEKRYLRRDGSVLWARVSARARRVDGEPTVVVTHMEDITERRDAEVALERSELRARAIVSVLHEGIIVRDGSGAVLEHNDALLGMLGLTAGQVTEQEPLPEGWHVVAPDETPMRRDEFPDYRTMQDGIPRIGVPLGIACDGRPTRWFRVNVIPFDNPDGTRGVITSFGEETERLAAERQVVLARDRFSALVEHSSDLVSVLVPGENRYEWTSPSWDHVLGWDPMTLDVDGLAARIHPDDLPLAMDIAVDVLAQPGRSRDFVMRVMHADGTWRYLDTTYTNLADNEAVGGMVVNCHDITEQVNTAAELAQMAMHDGLTGLPNRRLVLDRIGQALEEQRREATTVAVLFLDLDDFKQVNDAHGHAAGDQLLITVGQRLSGAVRAMDTVGRMGGDEFVIVAVLRELDGAASIARHVEEALEEPIRIGPKILARMQASIGVVVSRADRPRTADELLAEADSAMYEVKRRRRHLRAVT